MAAWRFPVSTNEQGDVVDIRFTGEKVGQEKLMFDRIAPYVEAGSTITMGGVYDDNRWTYYFAGDHVKEK